jgi:hypothetical protein
MPSQAEDLIARASEETGSPSHKSTRRNAPPANCHLMQPLDLTQMLCGKSPAWAENRCCIDHCGTFEPSAIDATHRAAQT